VFAWDPAQYSRFDQERLRPALDLLAQIRHEHPRLVYDLGTGRGQMARFMAERWPAADVIGTDTSLDMLAEAAATPSRVRWLEQDVRHWDPPVPPDIIYSNAMLHWVPDHDDLIVRLLGSLRPGGVLAIQMPLSWSEPSHLLMREVLAGKGGEPLGSEDLRARIGKRPVAEPEHYHDLLRPISSDLSMWKSVFYQQLTGEDAVLEWVKGSALRPILDGLGEDDRDGFLASYRERLRTAYPRHADGTTIFPFPRLFIVAGKDRASRSGR
jgi:trans-aconitate 2-methyltransferase